MAMVIIGLMKDPRDARGAVTALREAGFATEKIDTQGGLADCLSEMGVPEGEIAIYAEAIRRGGMLVGATAGTEREAEDAAQIMAEHGAVDLGACAESWDPAEAELIFGDQPIARGTVYRDLRSHGYEGPDRRMHDQPYAGVNRRTA